MPNLNEEKEIPMRKHPVAVIGCGNIAQSAHIPSYVKTGRADIRYLVDILPDKAKVLQENST